LPNSPDTLGSAVRTVSGLTLLSRVAGLARDLILVRIFGNTAVGSAFAAAFTIPNLFRRLFGEGALSAAFLPEYADALHNDDADATESRHHPTEAARFASATLALLTGATAALTVLIELGLLGVLVFAHGDGTRALSLHLIMVTLPFMPLVCVAALFGGMLQTHGSFAPTASAPLILNAFLIAGGLWHFAAGAQSVTTSYVLAVAAVAAGIAQVAWSFFALPRDAHLTRTFAGSGARLRRMLRRFGPVVIGLGTLQLNSLFDMLIAMWPNWVGPTVAGFDYPLATDSNAVLFFSQRLYQFPLGVFGIAVATAVFPLLAKTARQADAFLGTLRRGVRLSLFIGLPASAGLALVHGDLVRVLFGGGSSGFDSSGDARAAAVLLGYSAAVWAYSLNHVLTRAFYARGDTRTPTKVAVAAVALNLVLNVVLIWPLAEAGLAWSTAICAITQCLALAFLLRRRLGGPVLDRTAARALVRTIAATLGMGGAVALLLFLWPEPGSWGARAGRLGASCGLGIAVYAALTATAPESRWLLTRPSR